MCISQLYLSGACRILFCMTFWLFCRLFGSAGFLSLSHNVGHKTGNAFFFCLQLSRSYDCLFYACSPVLHIRQPSLLPFSLPELPLFNQLGCVVLDSASAVLQYFCCCLRIALVVSNIFFEIVADHPILFSWH